MSESSPEQAKRTSRFAIIAAIAGGMKKAACQATQCVAGVGRWTATRIRNSNPWQVGLLSFLLITFGAACALIAYHVSQPKPLVPRTEIVDPWSLLVSVGVSFVAFFVILHVAIRFAWPKDKRLLYSIEYAYLVLGLVSLIGVTSYGMDQLTYFRDQYGDSEKAIRGAIKQLIDQRDEELQCRFFLRGDRRWGSCAWLESARALADKAQPDHEEVQNLFGKGRQIVQDLGEIGRQDSAQKMEKLVEEVRGKLDAVVERATVGAILSDKLKDGKAPTFPKLYAFYLLAFAAALRMTKVSLEMLGLIAK